MPNATVTSPVVLEPAAEAFVEATRKRPFLFELGPAKGREALDRLQSGKIDKPWADIIDRTIPGGPHGDDVFIRILRPHNVTGSLPAIVYMHGAGWVFGDKNTHDRLARELAAGTGAAVIFVNYHRSPEASYPTALEEGYATLEWAARHGALANLDGSRLAVAGDSVGGNMSAALALLATHRSGPKLAAQALFYPVTDASFDTPSYHEFAEGYHLRRDAMQWFWDQYTRDNSQRAEITASPLRADPEQLRGLPQTLILTAEADVLRDEGERYAAKLRTAGVPVTAVRYEGIIHDFMMLNALRETNAATAATKQAIGFLKEALAL